MKSKKVLSLLAAGVALSLTSCSESERAKGADPHQGHDHADHDHDHDHAVKSVGKAGPNGGRVIHGVEPHLEFFVTADRKIQMTALDDSLAPIAMGNQVVRVTMGDRANPVNLDLAKEGNILISAQSFPAGDDFPIVLQIKGDESSENVFEKFTLNLTQCPTCDYLEYACTCDHGEGGDDHGHNHE